MQKLIRITLSFVVSLACLTAAAPARPAAADDTVKGGLEEVGEAVKRDTKEAVQKTDEEIKRGEKATERGVGKALDKTGEGLEHGGEKLEDHSK